MIAVTITSRLRRCSKLQRVPEGEHDVIVVPWSKHSLGLGLLLQSGVLVLRSAYNNNLSGRAVLKSLSVYLKGPGNHLFKCMVCLTAAKNPKKPPVKSRNLERDQAAQRHQKVHAEMTTITFLRSPSVTQAQNYGDYLCFCAREQLQPAGWKTFNYKDTQCNVFFS